MIRFTQVHETFRLAEIEALAVLEGIKLEVLYYSPSVRFSSKNIRILAHNFRSHHFALSSWDPRMQQEDLSVEASSQKQSTRFGETAHPMRISMTISEASPSTFGPNTKTAHSNFLSTLSKVPGLRRSSES
jgi:tRNA G10  N-methylase Trm11